MSARAAFIAAYSLAYIIVGLYPFDFDPGADLRFYSFGSWPDVVANIVAFVPFGIAFAWEPRPPSAPLRAAVFCAALALCIELLQIFVPERFPQISDVVCNSAGGWLGAWLWSLRTRNRRYTET